MGLQKNIKPKISIKMGNNRLDLVITTKSKWFKPQMAWNRYITSRITHRN
jgi:hypothetical protein